MAQSDKPRFERVEQISSPGKFYFATDLVSSSGEQLPNNHGLSNGVVLGQRPAWYYHLERLLQDVYPQTQWIYRYQEEENDPNSPLVEEKSPWLGQSGRISINDQIYRFSAGINSAHVNTSELYMRAERKPGEADLELPGYEVINGLIELEEIWSGRGEEYDGQPFWRGWVRLEGSEPREPIQLLIDQINQDIKKNEFAVFRDLDYQAPLSILGPRLVNPSRIRTNPTASKQPPV